MLAIVCLFSQPVPFVGSTNIFARALPDGRQALIYGMDVTLDEPVAMVLPLPVPPHSPEDAVTFVNLEGYAELFTDLASAFPSADDMQTLSLSRGAPAPAATLAVHEVGMFVASFVPTRADFTRLDERFRLPAGVWDQLPAYADWGFAVFQLAPPKKSWWGTAKRSTQTIHPMALTFPAREPEALYFPLIHVHDGAHVEPTAHFDHALFCQADPVLGASIDWMRSTSALGSSVETHRAPGLFEPDSGGFTLPLEGTLANADLWLRPPPGVRTEDLHGTGDSYAYTVKLWLANSQRRLEQARYKRWCTTARTRGAALCAGMRDGLATLTAAHRDRWQLAPLRDDLPTHSIHGLELLTGTAMPSGPGRVTFTPSSEHVQEQSVTLAFRELPDSNRVSEILDELSKLLDRAVA